MTIHRILVLGHSGFIGRRVMALLGQETRRHNPSCEVVGLSYPEVDLANAESARKIEPLLDERTALIMLSGIKRQLGDDADIFRRNMDMVLHMTACLERNPAGRVIFISSAAVYGEEVHNLAISERSPVCPQSYYGIAKFAAERVLHAWAASQTGVSLACVRPPLVYGPGDESRSYGPSGFIHAARNGQTITLWGDGSELREFVFVDDLARLLAELVFSGYDGMLNAASGLPASFQAILDCLRVHFPDMTVQEKPRSKSKVDNGFDATRLRSAFPDFAFTPIEEGLMLTVQAM